MPRKAWMEFSFVMARFGLSRFNVQRKVEFSNRSSVFAPNRLINLLIMTLGQMVV